MQPRDPKNAKFIHRIRRRSVLKGIGAAGLGSALGAPYIIGKANAQSAVNLSFWTFENPQQRPWIHRRINQYMEQNPHVNVEFQYFTFNDLGGRLSTGFATGTAPDGFVSQDWFMPTWLSRDLLAPMDVGLLGYDSVDDFRADFAPAFISSAVQGDQVYGYPLWFYGFTNYINENHFREIGLDPDTDGPKTWQEFGEVAEALTIKENGRFLRQGFKWAMHSPMWSVIQFNPILLQHGGSWFDDDGKCTINNEAGVEAMRVRASIARDFNAEDPAESIATAPLPMMDWLHERCSMFFNHPIPRSAVESQNPQMADEAYYRPVQYPGVLAGEGYPTTYGFNLVINKNAPEEKQEALHGMYRFMMSDLVDAWEHTSPFTLPHRTGWIEHPDVQNYPHVNELITAMNNGAALPRTTHYNQLAEALHRAIQEVMLNNGDIQAALNSAAAEVDRATQN